MRLRVGGFRRFDRLGCWRLGFRGTRGWGRCCFRPLGSGLVDRFLRRCRGPGDGLDGRFDLRCRRAHRLDAQGLWRSHWRLFRRWWPEDRARDGLQDLVDHLSRYALHRRRLQQGPQQDQVHGRSHQQGGRRGPAARGQGHRLQFKRGHSIPSHWAALPLLRRSGAGLAAVARTVPTGERPRQARRSGAVGIDDGQGDHAVSFCHRGTCGLRAT